MKQIYQMQLLLSFICSGVMAGCNTHEDAEPPQIKAQINAGIRNTNEHVLLDPFEGNAAIGIFMESAQVTAQAENRKYYKVEGDGQTGFIPMSPDQTFYYPLNGSSVDFRAYAPYSDQTTEGIVPVNLLKQKPLSEIDLLCAEPISGKSAANPDVSFVFRHVLTKLHFDLNPGKGITEADLAGTSIEIRGISTHASFIVANSSLVDRSDATGTIRVTANAGNPSAEAILLPIEKADGVEFLFTLKNLNLRYAVPTNQLFKAGTQYNYTVKINDPAENLPPLEIGCSISDWINKDHEIEI